MRPALEIARRELQDNLATWKLPLALVLTTVLLLAGVLSLAGAYEDATDAHDLVQDEYAADQQENEPPALAHRFLGRPQPLALLVGGPAESIRETVASAPIVTNETASQRQDPLRLRFSPTDLGTVGVGILSLLAILVAYDGIAGEKERGTLKLVLLNPLTRADVLLGKYLGAMATVVLPLLLAVALAVPLMAALGVAFAPSDIARLLLVLVALVVFLSAVVLMALAVSALTTRSAVSILALSVLWLLLVAGAGSLAAFAATVEPEGRGADEVLAEMRLLHESYDEERADLAAEMAALERKNATQGGTLSPAEEARLRGLRQEIASLRVQEAQDERALLEGYLRGRELDHQQAERLAAASPAEAFRSAAQRLARTDYDAARDRLQEFSAYLQELEDLRLEHAASGRSNESFEPPAFRNAPVTTGRDLGRAGPFLGALAVQNALALVVAVLAFGRYDVR